MFVNPATLHARRREDLFERRPKSERPIADREIGCKLQSALLQLAQQIEPALLGFAHAVLNRQKALLPALVDADQHQRAQPFVLGAQSRVDAIGPYVDPAILAQGLAPPRLVLLAPTLLEPRPHRRPQSLRLRPPPRSER